MDCCNRIHRYRSRYHRPRGLRNFLGEVFVFVGDTVVAVATVALDAVAAAAAVVGVVGVVGVRLFHFTVSFDGRISADDADIGAKLLIQCFCGKSFSGIFCTQTSGCSFKSICVSFISVGERRNFDLVDIFLSVRSNMLVVVDAAAAN